MDPEFLGSLIDGHAAALVLFARQWCSAPEDVVQEALVELARLRQAPPAPVPWLFRTVRNRAISRYRADRRRAHYEKQAAEAKCTWFELPEDPGGLDAVAAAERLAELPVEQREVIVAHLWGGLTFEQIAELSDSSAATVWRRYSAGLAALRVKLRIACPNPTTK